ncbi:MAG: DNA recombination protein RmuC [Alphaproteobacteria bacterium]
MENVASAGAGGSDTALLWVLAVIGVLMLAGLGTLIALLWRQSQEHQRETSQQENAARVFETEVAELKGRLQAMAEVASTRQTELSNTINERLDRVTQSLGVNMEETSRRTTENLAKLNERLAVIDTAQANITELSTRVVSLQDVLANKQQRGAFGQMRMETIIQDGLPREAYEFQATLSNGKRPDCLIRLPGADASVVIDAKFPLEGFEALRAATDEAARKDASRKISAQIGKHVDDIASKYSLPGETQDTMLMFVPSESIYADLHENFPDVLQKAYRARVMIVSPNMLMLAVQTMQAILKDSQMREQASVIQREVTTMMVDVNRLKERVLDLQRHFGLLGGDVEKILTSTDKITSRARKIENLELGDAGGSAEGEGAVLSNGSGASLPA